MPLRQAASYEGRYNCSAECWELYTEVLAAEFENAMLFGQVHQLTVDAYAVQHAGGRKPDKSLAIHLAGLYLMLERGVRPASVLPIFQKLATEVRDWPRFQTPEPVPAITVWDIALAGSDGEHAAKVREWARSIWQAWTKQHGEVATFVGEYIDFGEIPRQQRSIVR